jgi:MFS family permease
MLARVFCKTHPLREGPSTAVNDHPTANPFAIRNIRLFIYFRIFFNSRFYYPVFTVLFLDFGLTIEQFALLNVAWALTIVVLEVPSGALADIIGRKALLVVTGSLMVVEMALLCFVPRGNPDLLFVVFLFNRILSGTAEAAASGADEALAYDALKKEGDVSHWGRVLEKQMRLQAAAYIVAMSLGAAVYDPVTMGAITRWMGLNIPFTQETTLRFPIYLTMLMAILALLTTLQMKDSDTLDAPGTGAGNAPPLRRSVLEAFRLTLRSGGWILKTPFALVVILVGLVFDSGTRMIMTLVSQYYRLIDLPEAVFGLVGSAMALTGLFIPRLALQLVQRRSPAFNLWVLAVVTTAGLLGMTLFVPIVGVVPVFLLSGSMYLLRFFQSHYLNRITESSRRATVLSFKGLSLNMAYALVGILYSVLAAHLREAGLQDNPSIAAGLLKNRVFIESMGWFPLFFLAAFTLLVLYARRKLRNANAEF